MNEALLFLLNVFVFTYLCWLIVKADKVKTKTGRRKSIGVFAYKDDAES
jgi:hypothetical protein